MAQTYKLLNIEQTGSNPEVDYNEKVLNGPFFIWINNKNIFLYMSCEDKNANLDDAVSDINRDLKLDEIALSQIEELLAENPDLNEIIEQQALCDLPSDPVFTMSQLEKLGCDIEGLTELPDVPSTINLDTNVEDLDNGKKCEAALEKANQQLRIEQQEYTELRILLEKLIEYRDSYKAL